MGIMAARRGIGCVISGPISEVLLILPKWHAEGFYGTQFGWLISFTGVTSLLGRFGLFGDFGLRSQEGNKLEMEARSEDSEREPLLQ